MTNQEELYILFEILNGRMVKIVETKYELHQWYLFINHNHYAIRIFPTAFKLTKCSSIQRLLNQLIKNIQDGKVYFTGYENDWDPDLRILRGTTMHLTNEVDRYELVRI